MPGEHFLEAEDAFDPHQGVELLAGVGKVLAQALVDADATGDQFMLENLLEQRRTTAATGAGLGLLLELPELATAVVDGRADRAFADVVAGADGGAVRQSVGTQGRCTGGLRQDQCRRIGRQGDAVLHVLQQSVVVTVVAHQHRTEYAFATGIDHQTAIRRAGFVNKAVAARSGGCAVRIADRADIHTEQLELGRHVGAGKTGGVLTRQRRRDIARHAVTRCNQAEHTAVPRSALADGIDVWIAAATGAVDHHPAARGNLQTAAAAQSILRTNPGGEHDQVRFEKLAALEVHPVAIVFTGHHRLGRPRQVHADPERFDLRTQGRAAFSVQLHRHQARGEFHYVRFQAQRLEGVGSLKPQQATTDHHATPGIGCRGADGIEIIEGAVNQTRSALAALDRRHKGIRAGGQDQLVIGVTPRRSQHLPALAINLKHRFAQVQIHPMPGIQTRGAEGQGFSAAAAEIFGQVHAVVGTLAFLTEHPQLITAQGAAFDQLLDAVMPDHAVADDDQFFPLGDGRCCIHTRSSLKAIHGGCTAGASPEKQKKAPGAEAPGAFAWWFYVVPGADRH
ncbi:hypothetical protein D3C78_687410 [compost metagenome]